MSDIADDETHVWFMYDKFECCTKCGIVRRADRKNKPCKGVIKVTLREGDKQ